MGKLCKHAIYALLLLVCLSFPSVKATNVTLAWDPSPDAGASDGVAGYKLYYSLQDFTAGPPVGASILSIALGATTSVTVGNLTGGVTYYFAVVYVDDKGAESEFSEAAAYTVPFDSGETGDTESSSPTEINLTGVLPRLWPYLVDGQMILSIQGSLGATFAIQSSSNPSAPDSWITIANITLSSVAPYANPAPASTFERAFIPAVETFQDPNPPDGELRAYRIHMPVSYPILTDKLLNEQGFHSRLYSVSLPGDPDHVVCYVDEEVGYLDYNQSNQTVKIQAARPSIYEIATKVAAAAGQNWISASEFVIAEDGERIVLDTILSFVEPLPDSPPTDQVISEDPILPEL